jgi:hypothetical protein
MFFTAGNLYQSLGPDVLMPQNGLLLLVTSTGNSEFTEITPTTTFFEGFSLNGSDDLVLAKWNLDEPGVIANRPFTISSFGVMSPSWNAGDPLRIYWFPTLTTASESAPVGTQYNFFPNHDTEVSPDINSWRTPSDGGIDVFEFLTESGDDAGTFPDSRGLANITVVPEPSTYAALFALGCMAWAAATRRRRRAL